MNEIVIVGGVYGEECAFPIRNQIFGSAGRAAIALSAPHFQTVSLHTVLSPEAAKSAIPNFDAYGVDVTVHEGKQFVGFEYLHCLAVPVIHPAPSSIVQQKPFHAEGELLIQFGMMEYSPTVDANICIYDPQSPTNPIPFKDTGSKAGRLAFIANAGEIGQMTGQSLDKGASQLLVDNNAEIVVAKCGLMGAKVFTKNGLIGAVPAFRTQKVFTVGSGDIFVAAFALAWGKEGADPMEAARFASLAVADYVESERLPIIATADASTIKRDEVRLSPGTVYLAGPFRELGQRVVINESRKILTDLGMRIFSPVHDIGHGPAQTVVQQDLEAIKKCDVMFAILNGSSPGTLFEVGYAVAHNKPVYCVAQNMRSNDTKLPEGSGCVIQDDFVSALHSLAWRS